MILRNDINNGSEKQQRQPRYVSDKSRSDSRFVTRVVDSIQTLEGEGFLVHRAFPSVSRMYLLSIIRSTSTASDK
jgi:hypothetical protein